MEPNDTSGLHISGHIKIYDPLTNEIYVSKRCDGSPVSQQPVLDNDNQLSENKLNDI